jgi:MYXO-CTERM domain-containing protein
MNAHCALGAVAALAIGTHTFADDQQTIQIGSFVNTGVGSVGYNGPYTDHVLYEAVDGHTVISVDVTGILDSLGYNALWSITITDNGFNGYGALSPGADIDLFAIEGVSAAAMYAYVGPNAVHQGETADRLAERSLLLDSFSGAQDAWNITHVSLGMNGAVTASWAQPVDLRQFVEGSDGATSPGTGFGSGWLGYVPPVDSEGGDAPVLFISEHGTFESFSVSMVASTIPAPGALALLALAGVVGKSRRRK